MAEEKKKPKADYFDLVPIQADLPKEEETVLAHWTEKDCFRQSIKLSEGRPEYTFYDGPPFATGMLEHS